MTKFDFWRRFFAPRARNAGAGNLQYGNDMRDDSQSGVTIGEERASAVFREIQKGSSIFIGDGMLPPEACQEMIQRFEHDHRHRASALGENRVDPNFRLGTEMNLSDYDDWANFDRLLLSSLNFALNDIANILPFLSPRLIFRDEGYVLQRVKPGEYYHWHYDFMFDQQRSRHLSVIWYLNDIDDGGETEFKYQNVAIRPKRGRMAVFPPYWSHLHRGRSPVEETKYIVTTWISCEKVATNN